MLKRVCMRVARVSKSLNEGYRNRIFCLDEKNIFPRQTRDKRLAVYFRENSTSESTQKL